MYVYQSALFKCIDLDAGTCVKSISVYTMQRTFIPSQCYEM